MKKILHKSNLFLIWIFILCIGFVTKAFQNDTFYTIKIGELIINNGIDMLDHFSFHSNLLYTYPHWLYDVFIYGIYFLFGYTGIYISTIIFFMVLLFIVYKVNLLNCNNKIIASFGVLICLLSIASFVTARAQLISFILFALQIFFIESYLKNEKKKYLWGLLLISALLCNIHVAVWPFYFILYLPYLVEYLCSFIIDKIKSNNKIIKFIRKKIIFEKNPAIKYIFIVMIVSLLTGLLTPIGDTPYTYLIKTMMGNSQSYILEHQMITWMRSPFTIIIAIETIMLAFLGKIKLRDLFMICGLVIMSIFSIRHISLLALIGTICFSRVFTIFIDNFKLDLDKQIGNFFKKKVVIYISLTIAVIVSGTLFYFQSKNDFINKELYPVDAVNYIKKNIDIESMRIFNDYNFGSYLLLNDIPVFIDSRADLYTKQFSSFDYDIFDDYYYIGMNYQERFEFYKITHVLIYKKDNPLFKILSNDNHYKILFEDDNFCLYEKIKTHDVIVTYD